MAAVLCMIGLLLGGNREVLLLRGCCDRSQGCLENCQAFLELFVSDDQGHENAHHIAVCPSRNGDEAVFVTMLRDLFRLFVGGLTRLCVANEFDRTHAAKTPNIADERPLFLPGTRALFEALPDGGRTSQQSFLSIVSIEASA